MLVFSSDCLKLFAYYIHSSWIISSLPRVPINICINDSNDSNLHLQTRPLSYCPKLYFICWLNNLQWAVHTWHCITQTWTTQNSSFRANLFHFQHCSFSLSHHLTSHPTNSKSEIAWTLPLSHLIHSSPFHYLVNMFNILGTVLGIIETKMNKSQSLLTKS